MQRVISLVAIIIAISFFKLPSIRGDDNIEKTTAIKSSSSFDNSQGKHLFNKNNDIEQQGKQTLSTLRSATTFSFNNNEQENSGSNRSRKEQEDNDECSDFENESECNNGRIGDGFTSYQCRWCKIFGLFGNPCNFYGNVFCWPSLFS